MKQFESLDNCLDYLTPSLRSLSELLITRTNMKSRIAFIGQSYINAAGSTSKFNCPVTSSIYSVIQRFERNAALAKGENILTLMTSNTLSSSWQTMLIMILELLKERTRSM